MKAPYTSIYYENNGIYERFGNITLLANTEKYFYITDKEIDGIELNRYAISNRLNIYDYKEQKYLQPSKSVYLYVNLYNVKQNKYISYNIHRIYMLVFCYISGCENYDVNHIDGNKYNNHPSNLEWMTHKENMNHAFKYIIDTKLDDDNIRDIIKMYNSNYTIKDIANNFNISPSYVSYIIHGFSNREVSDNISKIKNECSVTREKLKSRIPDEDIPMIINRYNSGETYISISSEYNVDPSTLRKRINRYIKNHPDQKLIIKDRNLFDKEMATNICNFINSCDKTNTSDIVNKCIEYFHLNNDISTRKAICNIYNGKTYKDLYNKCNFREGSSTIEKVIE